MLLCREPDRQMEMPYKVKPFDTRLYMKVESRHSCLGAAVYRYRVLRLKYEQDLPKWEMSSHVFCRSAQAHALDRLREAQEVISLL